MRSSRPARRGRARARARGRACRGRARARGRASWSWSRPVDEGDPDLGLAASAGAAHLRPPPPTSPSSSRPRQQLDVGAAAGAQQERVVEREVLLAGPAVRPARRLVDLQRRALERRSRPWPARSRTSARPGPRRPAGRPAAARRCTGGRRCARAPTTPRSPRWPARACVHPACRLHGRSAAGPWQWRGLRDARRVACCAVRGIRRIGVRFTLGTAGRGRSGVPWATTGVGRHGHDGSSERGHRGAAAARRVERGPRPRSRARGADPGRRPGLGGRRDAGGQRGRDERARARRDRDPPPGQGRGDLPARGGRRREPAPSAPPRLHLHGRDRARAEDAGRVRRPLGSASRRATARSSGSSCWRPARPAATTPSTASARDRSDGRATPSRWSCATCRC